MQKNLLKIILLQTVSPRPVDRWILSRLTNLVHLCDGHFQASDLHLAAQACQWFIHHEFCDVYLVIIAFLVKK